MLQKQLYLFGAVALFITTANAQEKLSGIPSGTVATMSCEEAQKRSGEVLTGTASLEDMIKISATNNECAAAAFNKKAAQTNSEERVLPTANVQKVEGKNTVVFGLLSLSPKDEESLRLVCEAAGATVGAMTGDPLTTQVVTAAGKYSCGSYIQGLMESNKLLLIALTLLPGISVTKDVLKAVGIPEKTINKIEKDISNTVSRTTTDAVRGSVSVATGGIVKVDKKLKCVKIWGKKVCR